MSVTASFSRRLMENIGSSRTLSIVSRSLSTALPATAPDASVCVCAPSSTTESNKGVRGRMARGWRARRAHFEFFRRFVFHAAPAEKVLFLRLHFRLHVARVHPIEPLASGPAQKRRLSAPPARRARKCAHALEADIFLKTSQILAPTLIFELFAQNLCLFALFGIALLGAPHALDILKGLRVPALLKVLQFHNIATKKEKREKKSRADVSRRGTQCSGGKCEKGLETHQIAAAAAPHGRRRVCRSPSAMASTDANWFAVIGVGLQSFYPRFWSKK